jgi:hypothetical protein
MAGTPSPFLLVQQMINGFQMTQALHVVATLGVADALADGPIAAPEIAERVGANALMLKRLLRRLASEGVFAETADGRFELTPTAEILRSDAPNSLRAWAIMLGSPSFWTSWGDLLTTVRTGETAFPRVHGMDAWEYRETHPEAGAIFRAAMTERMSRELALVVSSYDFSDISVLADIGGSAGPLLAAVLVNHPGMRGILFDRPQVVAGAGEILSRAGIADRCEVVPGDFFESVPAGADAYLLKSIIHDWNDDEAIAILRQCHATMTSSSRLLLVELVVLEGNQPDPARFIDLMMAVMNGGMERTVAEYGRLLAAAGFSLTRVVPIGGLMNILEARPV